MNFGHEVTDLPPEMLGLVSCSLLAVLDGLAYLEKVDSVTFIVVLVVSDGFGVVTEYFLGFSRFEGASEDIGGGDFQIVFECESLT